jgi:hypothetical protein
MHPSEASVKLVRARQAIYMCDAPAGIHFF